MKAIAFAALVAACSPAASDGAAQAQLADLTFAHARLLVDSNPTAAVALVRPFASGPRWREARAVAAGARAAGVPWRLSGPARITFAALSPAGTQAIVGGGDGSLELHDLAARTHRTIAKLDPRARAVFTDETHVVAWADKTLTVIDLATGASRPLDRPAAIVRASGRDGTLYFTDDARRAWRLTAATGDALGIPIDGAVTHVAASPDGKHVAFAGDHLWMIETRRPDLPDKVRDGKAFDLAWSASGDQLAAIGQATAYQITVHPEIDIVEHPITAQSVAVAREHLYSMGPAGLVVDDRALGATELEASLLGFAVAKGEHVVAATRGGLRIFDGVHALDVPLPASPLTALHASPHAPYILAVSGSALFVLDVTHVMPRRGAPPPASTSAFAVRDDERGITVVDRDVSWRIARALPAGSAPTLAGDTVVLRDGDSTVLWPLDLPTTPAATATWIGGLTNATYDPRTGMIGWPP